MAEIETVTVTDTSGGPATVVVEDAALLGVDRIRLQAQKFPNHTITTPLPVRKLAQLTQESASANGNSHGPMVHSGNASWLELPTAFVDSADLSHGGFLRFEAMGRLNVSAGGTISFRLRGNDADTLASITSSALVIGGGVGQFHLTCTFASFGRTIDPAGGASTDEQHIHFVLDSLDEAGTHFRDQAFDRRTQATSPTSLNLLRNDNTLHLEAQTSIASVEIEVGLVTCFQYGGKGGVMY